jgi:hypothetical protein
VKERAWQVLRGSLDLPSEPLPLEAWTDGVSMDAGAEQFLAALEQPRIWSETGSTSVVQTAAEISLDKPEQKVDTEAFLASLEGWLRPVEWPEAVIEKEVASWREVEAEVEADVASMVAPVADTVERIPAVVAPTIKAPPVSAEPKNEAKDDVWCEISAAFCEEAKEGFDAMEASTLRREKAPERDAAWREVYRWVHGIKGATNAVGRPAVGRVYHIEDVLEDPLEGRMRGVEAASLSTLGLTIVDPLRVAVVSGAGVRLTWATEAGAMLVDRIVEWRRAALWAEP